MICVNPAPSKQTGVIAARFRWMTDYPSPVETLWKFERVGWHPSFPDGVLIFKEGEEAECRMYFDLLTQKWRDGWMRSFGSARLVNPEGVVVEEVFAPRPKEEGKKC